MTNHKKPLPISVEQSKLLGNTLRVKIIGVLINEPKTAKQVATQLGESPGNVHYHMQKLANGKLIELTEEKPVGGIIEKYYQAVSSTFSSPQDIYDELHPHFNPASLTKLSIALQLKEEDLEKVTIEFQDLIEKWVLKTSTPDYKDADEYIIGFNLVSRKEKKED